MLLMLTYEPGDGLWALLALVAAEGFQELHNAMGEEEYEFSVYFLLKDEYDDN